MPDQLLQDRWYRVLGEWPAGPSDTVNVIDPASAVGRTNVPTIKVVFVEPDAATAIGKTNIPTVDIDAAPVSPEPASAIGRTLDPFLGPPPNLYLIPGPATAIGRTSTAQLIEDLTIPLGAVTAIGKTLRGTETADPAAATAVGRTNVPTIDIDSLTVSPAAATAIGKTNVPNPLIDNIYVDGGNATAVGRTNTPTVNIDDLSLTPAPATAVGKTNDISPDITNLVVQPGNATAIGETIRGTETIDPGAAAAIGKTNTPTVDVDSLTVSPAPVQAIGKTNLPDVLIDNLEVAGGNATAVGRTNTPTVDIDDLFVTPAAATAVGRTNAITPGVTDLTLTPGNATAIGSRNAPTVDIDDLTIPLGAVAAIGKTTGAVAIFLVPPTISIDAGIREPDGTVYCDMPHPADVFLFDGPYYPNLPLTVRVADLNDLESVLGTWTDTDNTVRAGGVTINEFYVPGSEQSVGANSDPDLNSGDWRAFLPRRIQLITRHGDTVTYIIYDGDNQTDTISCTWHIRVYDPLESATNHPRNSLAEWQVWQLDGVTTLDDDFARGGSTTVTNPIPSHGKGLLIQGAVSATLTADATTTGYWTPIFQVGLPALNSRLTINTYINGALQQTRVYTDVWGVVDLQCQMVLDPIHLASVGDVGKVELIGDDWVTGGPISAPEAPFWTWSNFQFSATPPVPPGSGVFSWVAGDITKAEWDAERATLPPTNPNGRPRGDFTTFTNANITGAISHPITWEIAEMDTAGNFLFESYQDAGNIHTMLMVEGLTDMAGRYLLISPKRYTLSMDFDLDLTPEADWRNNVTWHIIAQLRPGSYGDAFTPAREPPVAVYLYPRSGEVRFWVRGSTQATPTNWTYNAYWSIPFAVGSHSLTIEVEMDWTGANSYTGFTWDGVLVHSTTRENTINRMGQTENGQNTFSCGSYSSQTAGQITRFSRIQIDSI